MLSRETKDDLGDTELAGRRRDGRSYLLLDIKPVLCYWAIVTTLLFGRRCTLQLSKICLVTSLETPSTSILAGCKSGDYYYSLIAF
jgi:hypothetical protein